MKSIFKILFICCCSPVALFAQTSVDDVINTYFKAIGGVELIEQINTLSSVSQTEINGDKLTVYNKQQTPNLKSVVLYKNDLFLSKKVFNGKSGYEVMGKVKKNYTKAEIIKKLNQINIFPEYYYLNKAVYLGEREVLGKRCNVLGVGEKRIYYDVASGLKLKGTSVKFINGQRIKQEVYYLDYKEIKGVKFPATYKILIKDKEIIYIVQSISLNKDVAPSDFE